MEVFPVKFETEKQVREFLILLNEGAPGSKKMSWAKFKNMPILKQINPSTLNGYARGRPIKNSEHRLIFGLPALIEVLPCPSCGKAHNHDCGCQKIISLPGSGKKRNRASINLDSMESAAQTIASKLQDDPENLQSLIDSLVYWRSKQFVHISKDTRGGGYLQ